MPPSDRANTRPSDLRSKSLKWAGSACPFKSYAGPPRVTGAWGAGGAHDALLKDTTNGSQRG